MNMEIIMAIIIVIIGIAKFLLIKNQVKNNQKVYGNWLSESKSYYSFNEDGTYKWYKDTENIKNDYQEGSITVINGEKALKALEITESQFDSLFSQYTNDKNDVYYIKLKPRKIVSNGLNKSYMLGKKASLELYVILLADGRGIFTNLESEEVLQFEKIEEE